MQNSCLKDLKSIKTENALNAAMFTLLEKRSFEKITVIDICEKALVSRATFYAHFADKYDLLQKWISELIPPQIANNSWAYGQFVEFIDKLMRGNEKIFRNLIRDASKETMGILFDVMRATLNFDTNTEKTDAESIACSTFYAGGMLHYFLHKIENKFPADIQSSDMNKYLYKIIRHLKTFETEGDCTL